MKEVWHWLRADVILAAIAALRGDMVDLLRAVGVGDFGTECGSANLAGLLVEHGSK